MLRHADVSEDQLCSAAELGQLDVVKRLIERDVPFDMPNSEGKTPLYFAAQNGHLEVVKFLMAKGANPTAKHSIQESPLVAALAAKQEKVAEFIINNMKTVDEANGIEIAAGAAYYGMLSCLKLLIEQKGVQARQLDKRGYSLLHQVAWGNGNVDMAKYLLKQGVMVDASEHRGYTPLHTAAAEGHVDLIRYLLEEGAEFKKKDNFSHTPLFWTGAEG